MQEKTLEKNTSSGQQHSHQHSRKIEATHQYSEKTEKDAPLDADTNVNSIYQKHLFKLESITHQERNWERGDRGRGSTLTSTRTHLFIFQNQGHKFHL